MNVVIAILLLMIPAIVRATPASLTYQGRIMKADGSPLEHSSVSFQFEIVNSGGSCVLYREQVDGINMANSKGMFDIKIGASHSYPPSPTKTLLDSLDNSGPLVCDGGVVYNPVPTDGRILRVQFFDGTSWRLISPDSVIRSVPYAGFAASAAKLNGLEASSFVLKTEVNNNTSCSAGSFITWNAATQKFGCEAAPAGGSGSGTVTNVTSGNSYLSVVNATTTPVLTVNVGTSANTLAAGNDSRIVGALQSGAVVAGDLSGTLPNPTVEKIQGVQVDFSTPPVTGQVLTFDGSKWVSSALPTGGGGGVTSVTAGPGLTGGTITTTGTIGLGAPLSGLNAVATNGYIQRTGTGTYSTTSASSLASNNNLVMRDGSGTGNFYGLGLSGATSGSVLLQASATSGNYSLTFPDAQGGPNQFLSNNGSGLLSWTNVPPTPGAACAANNVLTYNGTSFVCVPDQTTSAGSGITSINGDSTSSQSFDIGTSGTAPAFISASGVHTLNIPLASTASVTAGLISNAQYNIFAGKQDAFGSQTAKKVFASPLAANGLPTFRSLNIKDIASSLGGDFLTATGSCPAGQSLTYLSASDSLSCQAYAITSSQVTSALGYTPTNLAYTPVNKAGDTMTGRLGLATAGFHVATKNDITTRTDSGFYQTDTATTAEGWPTNSNGWYHLLTSTHSNDGNYYSMQFAGDFGVQGDLFYRATNGTGTAAWSRVWNSANLTNLNQLSNGPGYITGINATNVTTALGYTPANRAGDNFTGTVNAPNHGITGPYGTSYLGVGTGDGASYSTYNIKLQSWYGIGMATYDGSINGFYDSRAGLWDVKGGYRVNGSNVWTQASLSNLNQLSNGPGYITGINSAMVTNALGYTPLSNTSTSGQSIAYNGPGGPQVLGAGGGASMISFHRPGSYAVNFGLDTDNVLRVGGWSMGGPFTIWHSGNFDPGSKLTLNAWNGSSYVATDGRHYGTIYYDANDGNYYVDPNGNSNVGKFTFNGGWDGYNGGIVVSTDAPSLTFNDTNTSIRWMIHNNDDKMSFYRAGSAGGTDWAEKFRQDWAGNIWSSSYGWLHDRFASLGSSVTFHDMVMNGGTIRRPDDGGQLTLRGGSSENGGGSILIGGAGSGLPGKVYLQSRGPSGTAADIIFRRYDGSAVINLGYFMGNGNMWIQGSLTQASDIRLKTNLQYLSSEESLRKIASLNAIFYDWKDHKLRGHERQLGLIAQEVQKVFPEAVKEDQEGFLSVTYSNLIAPVIESIKELLKQTQTHNREIASLKEQNLKVMVENEQLKEKIKKMESDMSEVKKKLGIK